MEDEDSQRPTLEELQNSTHAEWIKIEPEDHVDLGQLPNDNEEDEATDHEGLDEDEAENESWMDLFATGSNNIDDGSTGENTDFVMVCSPVRSV